MNKIDITSRHLSAHLDKLEAFAAIAEMGSITRACRKVGLSQSALSHLVSKLEEGVDAPLFIRRSRGLELTEEGAMLLEFAKRLATDIESLSSRIVSGKTKAFTRLRVGTHETLSAHIWPRIAREFASKKASYATFAVTSGRVDDLIEKVMQGALHLALSVEPKPNDRLQIRPLYSGSLEFYASPDWLRKRDIKQKSGSVRLKSKDLTGVPLFTDVAAHVRQGLSIPKALNEIGMFLSDDFEVTSFEAAVNLAEAGLGVAALPDRNALKSIAQGKLIRLEMEGMKLRSSLKYRICLSSLADSENGSIYERLYSDLKTLLA